MRKALMTAVLLGGLIAFPLSAQAHCDSIDTNNVYLVLPYAPASAEAELGEAFRQAVAVRAAGGEAKGLADRYFMETAVRLHRAGEHAPYTGLKPAGTDFGPAIPAAEKSLETNDLEPVLAVLTEAAAHGAHAKFQDAAHLHAEKEPTTHAEVAAARERVTADLGFIGYIEGIYLATQSSGHIEGGERAAAHSE
jgi:hypothetical protein